MTKEEKERKELAEITADTVEAIGYCMAYCSVGIMAIAKATGRSEESVRNECLKIAEETARRMKNHEAIRN